MTREGRLDKQPIKRSVSVTQPGAPHPGETLQLAVIAQRGQHVAGLQLLTHVRIDHQSVRPHDGDDGGAGLAAHLRLAQRAADQWATFRQREPGEFEQAPRMFERVHLRVISWIW